MSLEVSGSLSSSWTVREVQGFADDFSKIESRTTQAVVVLSMAIIGPIALSMLILMDAIRGANYLVESLYWRDRVVEPSPASPALPPPLAHDPVPVIDPVKEILDEATAIQAKAANPLAISPKRAKELHERRMALVERVLDQVQNPDMDVENAAAFLRQVIESLKTSEMEMARLLEYPAEDGFLLLDEDGKPFSFEERFERAVFARMREQFLKDFIAKPEEAVGRLQKMELIFPAFEMKTILNESDIIPVMNAIGEELIRNLRLPVEEQVEKTAKLNELVDQIKDMGFPEDFENSVFEMQEQLFLLAGRIEKLQKENVQITENLQRLAAYIREGDDLVLNMQKEEEAIAALREQLPKEKTIKKEIDLRAQPGRAEEARASLQKQIEELQKEQDLLGEEGKKFEELNRELLEHQERFDAYRRKYEQINEEFLRCAEGEFVDSPKGLLRELKDKLAANQREIELLEQEIRRPLDEDDIIDLDEADSPVRSDDSPVHLDEETPPPTPIDFPSPQPQGLGSWLRSWIY